jgi:hypothetical protein
MVTSRRLCGVVPVTESSPCFCWPLCPCGLTSQTRRGRWRPSRRRRGVPKCRWRRCWCPEVTRPAGKTETWLRPRGLAPEGRTLNITDPPASDPSMSGSRNPFLKSCPNPKIPPPCAVSYFWTAAVRDFSFVPRL